MTTRLKDAPGSPGRCSRSPGRTSGRNARRRAPGSRPGALERERTALGPGGVTHFNSTALRHPGCSRASRMRRLCCGNPVVCCHLLQRTRGERMEPVQRPAADLAGERDQRPNVVPKQHVRVLLRAVKRREVHQRDVQRVPAGQGAAKVQEAFMERLVECTKSDLHSDRCQS